MKLSELIPPGTTTEEKITILKGVAQEMDREQLLNLVENILDILKEINLSHPFNRSGILDR